MAKPGRKKIDRSGIHFQQFITSSKAPEEMLFKLNEFLFGNQAEAVRKNPRIPVAFALRWKSGDKEKPGNSYTLSREGMFIKTPSPPKPKSEIEVRFCLPGSEHEIIAQGEVVHRIRMDEAKNKGVLGGMAVVFREIDPDAQKLLDDFINDRLKKIYSV